MESRTKYAIALVALTAFVLAVRLLVAFQVQEPTYPSYFALVQAESIHENGLPLTEDPYSYQGRTHAFNPLFYYLVAVLTMIFPAALVAKALPHVLLAALVPLTYLIGHKITKDRPASLLAAFFAGFSPALFAGGQDATPISLALPLLAATLLAYMELSERPIRALILTALLALATPLAWLFLAAYLIYFTILAAERIKVHPHALEAGLFAFLLIAWYTLLTYKVALHRYGLGLLAESLPSTVREATFADLTLLAMVYAVGVVPLALGSLALYHAAFEERSRRVFLLAALGLATLLTASLLVLPIDTALIILSLTFTLLAAPGMRLLNSYLRKTRFEWIRAPVAIAILLAFVLTSMLPAVVAGLYPGSAPTQNELAAYRWAQDKTPEDAVLLAAPRSGFLINYEARRAYVADEEYLLIRNPDAILLDIDAAYTTPSTVAATDILSRYGVTHVVIGPREHARYRSFGEILDRTCFPVVYENPQVAILQVNCTVIS